MRDEAERLDGLDPLAHKRNEFVLTEGVVYLDGNSLGILPRAVPARVADVVEREWGELRIQGWTTGGWWTAPERVGDRIGRVVGAAPGQVVVGDSTSVNLFKAVTAAVRMSRAAGGGSARSEILVDASTFPTDAYIAASVSRMTDTTVRSVPVAEMVGAVGPRTAAVLVNQVDYRTGRLYDLPPITRAAHGAGARVVWGLCHSAGAMPVELDAHEVDLAVGCGYKYLNGGPGAPAFLYIRASVQEAFDTPLPGWNSHVDPFGMADIYAPAQGASRGRVGTPTILSLMALDAALDVFDDVSPDALRTKSLLLTDFFLECLRDALDAGLLEVVTPLSHTERGSQISLRHAEAEQLISRLIAEGIIGDFREPDVLRFGFTPLYTSFEEVRTAADAVANAAAAM